MTPLAALLFTIPIAELESHFLAWLETYVEELAPRNATEIFLVSRIIQAVVRLQLSADNEPAGLPDAGWLRYETAADRLFRQSLTALEKYRRAFPVTEPLPTPKPTPTPVATQPVPPNPSTQTRPSSPTPNTPRPPTLVAPTSQSPHQTIAPNHPRSTANHPNNTNTNATNPQRAYGT